MRVKAVLILFLFMFTSIVQATVMGDLAATMNPGDWKVLNTNGLSQAFLKTSGYNCCNFSILQYAAKAVWDPGSEQFLFMGSPHSNPYKFIIYSAASNNWRSLPNPMPCMNIGSYEGGCSSHSYYYSSRDPVNGKYFYYLPGAKAPGEFDVATEKWTVLPTSLSTYAPSYGGLSFFPERNGMIYAHGWAGCWWYDYGAKRWSANVQGFSSDAYHTFSYYNPIHSLVLFGGGNGNNGMFIMDTDGNVTQPNPSPSPIGTNNGTITLDLVSGKFLVIYQGKTFKEYDVSTDTWKNLPDVPSDFVGTYSTGKGYVAAPVDNYGVIMFLLYEPAKVWLYKHSDTPAEISRKDLNNASHLGISVRPNPFNTIVNINYELGIRNYESQVFRIGIYDTRGKLVESLSNHTPNSSFLIRNSFSWNASQHPPGIYLLRAKLGNRTISKKLFLQR